MKLRSFVAALLAASGVVCVVQGGWIHAKAALAQHLLERAWDASVGEPAGARPWPWADTQPVGRLRVPDLDVDLIVLAGATGRTLAFAPGHLSSSAGIGQSGNAVIAGHRDTHFAFLRDLRIGQQIVTVAPSGAVTDYRVSELAVVDERDATAVDPWRPSALTLVTCFPFDTSVPGGPLRWVVVADRVGEARDSRVESNVLRRRPTPGSTS